MAPRRSPNRRSGPATRPNPRDATLEAAARARIEADRLDPAEGALLVAVSGGADSTALLHFLAAERARTGRPEALAAAHVNHRLRGAESDADASFARERAAAWGVPYFEATLGGRAAGEGAAHDDGRAGGEAAAPSEETLRRARYAALGSLAKEAGAAWIATAHTADDQAETVLFRMARGAGLRGLSGMGAKARVLGVSIARPFLDVTRDQVLDYLKRHEVAFREDASNESRGPARNWIRHEILPRFVAGVNPGVRDALLREAALFREADEFLQAEGARRFEEALLDRAGGKIVLDARRLLAYSKLLRTYVFRCAVQELNGAIRDFTTAHIDALLSLVSLSSGRSADLPRGLTARRERARIVLSRRLTEPAGRKRPSNA